MKTRVITVLKESDHSSSRYSLNECQVTVDGKSWRTDWTDGNLLLEQLQDRLIASGAAPDVVAQFREAVSSEAFQDGIEAGEGSMCLNSASV